MTRKNRIFTYGSESEERYRRLVELSTDGIAITLAWKIVFMNPAGIRILGGASPEDFRGRTVLDFIPPDHRELVNEQWREMMEKGESAPWCEVRLVRLDGREIEVEIASTPFLIRGKPAVQTIFRDITERRIAERRLEYLANFDSLTGLPNRRLFFDRIDQALLNAQRQKYLVGLLYVDLDRFKEVNDTFGHDVGDLLLQEAAARLSNTLPLSDSAARMGGDEFTVVLSKIVHAGDAGIVARRIIENLSRPYSLECCRASIGVSIGISIFPLDGTDTSTLLKKSDVAMYRAKGRGSNLYCYFEEPPE